MRKNNVKHLLAAAPPALHLGSLPSADGAFQYLAAIVNAATNWLMVFAIMFAVIMVIISGMKLMFAAGDEEKKKGARRTFIYALVGVVVVVLARNFVEVAQNFFTGQ